MTTRAYRNAEPDVRVEMLDIIAEDYNSVKEIDERGRFSPHTLEFFKIMQEIYESER